MQFSKRAPHSVLSTLLWASPYGFIIWSHSVHPSETPSGKAPGLTEGGEEWKDEYKLMIVLMWITRNGMYCEIATGKILFLKLKQYFL